MVWLDSVFTVLKSTRSVPIDWLRNGNGDDRCVACVPHCHKERDEVEMGEES